MNDAPSSGFFTQYVLENPWPLGLGMLALAAILAWMGLREGRSGRTRLGVGLGFVGVIIIAAGYWITTAGEHAKVIVTQLVEAAVTKDVVGGMALFADDAVMNTGSPQNAGFDLNSIQAAFNTLAAKYDIESNTITQVRAATISKRAAEVQLGCRTTVAQYPALSQWIVRVERRSDAGESWKITRLTCISINGSTPPLDRIW